MAFRSVVSAKRVKLMKAKIAFMFSLLAAVMLVVGGCGDDVKTVKKSETVHESSPQPVAPGEMIVE